MPVHTKDQRTHQILLEGKKALVTGASMGIGRGIATALADAGCELLLAGRSKTALQEFAAELKLQKSATAKAVMLDLNSVERIDEIVSEIGSVDILVNCGGIYDSGTMGSADRTSLEKLMRCNVLGPYELTRCLLPGISANRGQIVFINSSVVNNIGSHTGQFAATAQSLRAIADSLRAEVNPLGVKVLSVFPGRTATPRQQQIFAQEGREYKPDQLLQPEDIAEAVVNNLRLPATAEVTELWIRPARNFQS